MTDSTDPEIHEALYRSCSISARIGSGVRQKLFIDLYSPYQETLFIDSDCLVLGNLASFWTAFSGQIFGVPGF